MFHSNTELLIDYWRERRGERLFPTRTDIDPAAFAALLPQTFIAGRDTAGDYPIRLAGELLVDLFGRGLRGENLLGLWRRGGRAEVQAALEMTLRAPSPLVINVEARTDEDPAGRLELLFLPFASASGAADRFLGLCQPTAPLASLHGRPIRELSVRHIAGATPGAIVPRLRLAALDGRRIA